MKSKFNQIFKTNEYNLRCDDHTFPKKINCKKIIHVITIWGGLDVFSLNNIITLT
jgi:hypothetical protein